MPKQARALSSLPPQVRVKLAQLGENISIARKRQRETREAWALRMGVYATALWLIGRASFLPDLAAPQADLGALEAEVRTAQSRAIRKPVSITRRLDELP
jgi:hypothetical protein